MSDSTRSEPVAKGQSGPGAEALFAALDKMIAQTWGRASQEPVWRHVVDHGFTPELYTDLMVQIYHYTRFNSLNQAQAVLHVAPEQRALLRFAYRHADEELGHEMMVVHDLRAAGLVDPDEDIRCRPRVPATDALINYLAGLAHTEGAVARLGYSYWAEDAYGHLMPLLTAARNSLNLTPRQMTFFVNHSEIDLDHSAEVRRIITKVVTTPADRAALYQVAQTTLWLTTQIMVQTFEAWRLRSGSDA